MWVEIGHFCLILAALTALFGCAGGFYGGNKNHTAILSLVKTLSWLTAILVLAAFATLIYAFITSDFSVQYVAAHSNRQLPMFYKVAAVWGGHEGSLLLWLLLSYFWLSAFLIDLKKLSTKVQSYTLGVLLAAASGFNLFVLFTSNPFIRHLPAAADGADLNPLLQHPGLAAHPPMLYLGYVGFSVVFALTLAVLLANEFDEGLWAKIARRWTLAAWICLTLGIVFGSMWAYSELGWGGWWFWDPVENASFMPWLAGTALLHSLMVSEKRGLFRHWTVLLAISTFSLSLVGMFLVRSGVLVSVHAFASDPSRGIAMLVYLAAVLGFSLAVYSYRSPTLHRQGGFTLLSRETLLLANNILLITGCVTVLLGTLFPLLADVLQIGKFSVGAPYFNKVMLPIWLGLLIVLLPSARIGWQKSVWQKIRWEWLICCACGISISAVCIFNLGEWKTIPFLLMSAAWSMMFSHIYDLIRRHFRQPLRRWGMTAAHIGVAIFAIGAAAVSYYDTARDIVIEPHGSIEVVGHKLTFAHLEGKTAENYVAMVGHFRLDTSNGNSTVLKPEKRQYLSGGEPMTEAAIQHGFLRDIYVSLGEMQGSDAAVSPWLIRVYVKPLMNWMWAGCLLMVLGGSLVLLDRKK
ncbi:heme lyase CcmF/NrfE family subunit [Neisseria zalophi]|uniref:Heme lyase CcmF/NrfE family subunit n=1 Tax=Neisseria zalophi TaxID=640030 RepID=A0A5J6PXX7_9NEIS|nr:heme lyase CcmF/NrfE family subunit [Neisseria zalophi]QEY25762.1 heme lyase CcmF/NrfE family subunit [Neisseria zalophi]